MSIFGETVTKKLKKTFTTYLARMILCIPNDCKLESKHETVLLGMKREAQQVNDKICLEREKF